MPPNSEDTFRDDDADYVLPAWARPALIHLQEDFEPGDVVNDRFQIISMVGAGGMGQVYRVLDRRVGTERALKTLKASRLSVEEWILRFQRELIDAQQITHRNVCRVYDLDVTTSKDGERPFYTMELLEGETLTQCLKRRGSLTRAEALCVVKGVAAGLDAAHTTGQGIIHRDLKPDNIMLVPDSGGIRPVILDFGIAKRLDGSSKETTTGMRAGTPAYMAPEQHRGAKVSPATDVYALGRIMQEMFSPADLRVYHAVINRALLDDPTARFPSAGHLVGALNRADQTRRNWLRSSLAAIPVIVSIGVWRYRSTFAGFESTPLVLLAPAMVVNDSQGQADSIETEAVSRLLEYQTGRSNGIEIVTRARLRDRMRMLSGGMENPSPDSGLLRRVAAAEGAPFVMFTSVSRLGGRYELRLTLEREGRVLDSATFPFTETRDLPSVSGDAADWLRQTLSRPGLKPRDPGLPELTTDNWAAFQCYVRGDQAWTDRREADAIREFTEAVRLDPNFAGAEARLGDTLTASRHIDEGLLHWSRAAELVRKRALAGREMLRIRGLFALDIGDIKEAEQGFGLFLSAFPEDALAHFYYASVALHLNRPDQALDMMQRAAAIDPKNFAFNMGLATVHLFRAEPGLAKTTLKKAVVLKPNEGAPRQHLAAIAFAGGDFTGCATLLESILDRASDESKSRAFNARACLAAEQGRLDDAMHWISLGRQLDQRLGATVALGRKLRLQAECLIQQNLRSEAVTICKQILTLDLGAQTRMEAGCLFARAGAIDLAANCRMSHMPDWPVYNHWQTRLQGEIALARSDFANALNLMSRCPLRPDSGYWPEFLYRAVAAAGDTSRLQSMSARLIQKLAYYWMDPDRTALGFVRSLKAYSNGSSAFQGDRWGEHQQLYAEIASAQP